MSSTKIFLTSIVLGLIIMFTLNYRNLALRSDFVNYYTGATLIKVGEAKNLYQINSQQKVQEKIARFLDLKLLPFRSPPFVALLFFPFSFLSLEKGYLILSYLNIFILLLIYSLSQKIFKNIARNLLLVVLIFLPYSHLHTLLTGQTSIIQLLLTLYIYRCFKTKRLFLAGICTGLILFKPQLITLMPFLFLLAWNKKNYFLGFLISSTILFFISLFLVGWRQLLHYPVFLLATERESYGTFQWNSFSLVSLFSPVLNTFGIKGFGLLAFNFFFYIIALAFFYFNLKKQSFNQLFITAIILSLLFSIHALPQDLSYLTLTNLILFNQYYQLKSKNKMVVLFIGASLFLLMPFFILLAIFKIHINFGVVVLLAIAILLLNFDLKLGESLKTLRLRS